MDKLKNFIDANRDAFKEDEMLPEGHFERFEQKLPKPRKNRAALYSLSAFAIAASIALLLLFRLPEGTGLPEPAQKTTAQTCKRILTDNYMFEETILPTLPCSNDGLFAMTQHYSNSLEGLTLMLKQMEQVTDNQK